MKKKNTQTRILKNSFKYNSQMKFFIFATENEVNKFIYQKIKQFMIAFC